MSGYYQGVRGSPAASSFYRPDPDRTVTLVEPAAVPELLRKYLTHQPRWVCPPDCGVMTATDDGHFPGFQMLYTSVVRTHQVSFLLVDMGLTDRQRAWAARQPGLFIDRFSRRDLVVSTQEDAWQKWNKPFFIARSPFQRTLWLDTDCLVRWDLTPLFRHLQIQPFFSTHRPEWVNPNEPEVYRAMPLGEVDENFSANTGVVAFDMERDFWILHEWMSLVRFAVEHPRGLLRHFAWHDEGVFRLVLQKLRLSHLVWPDLHWNQTIFPPIDSLEAFLPTMQQNYHEDYILHFCSLPKPWERWGVELLDFDPHADL